MLGVHRLWRAQDVKEAAVLLHTLLTRRDEVDVKGEVGVQVRVVPAGGQQRVHSSRGTGEGKALRVTKLQEQGMVMRSWVGSR